MECIEEECSPQETFCNGISKKENFGGSTTRSFSINKNAKQCTVKSRVISPPLFLSYFKLKKLLLPIFYAHSKRRIVNPYKILQSGCFRIGDLQSGKKPDWRLTQIGEFLIGFFESSPIRFL
mmetsp:Transcript_8924/g.12934  ORF Transcript_8924/g.12934 Transcript_8924/m.12934 type:complete len:122 (-) Transcript_8924:208-573(-)